ncbi:GH17838 [Drosophila grimshawi]|uniref:GH17838 n=1 Tax=Drosophila grimshawi TaxID=7222 RepID=B4JWX3_DROGR|nr:GH17838 [Drosophila grimshawi]
MNFNRMDSAHRLRVDIKLFGGNVMEPTKTNNNNNDIIKAEIETAPESSICDMTDSPDANKTEGDNELTNEISAPYEVPQFPIEQIEKKLQIQRQLNVK